MANPVPESNDHRAWSAYWGEECLRTINYFLAGDGNMRIREEHIRRCAKMAWWHAARLKGYKYWDARWTAEQK